MLIKETNLFLIFLFGIIFLSNGFFVIHENANAQTPPVVPDWIKTLAKFWSNNEIPDNNFIGAIEHLIKNKIISSEKIIIVEKNDDVNDEILNQETIIPEWIRTTAEWYSENLVTDSEFVSSIEFMVKEGIIQSPKIQIKEDTPSPPSEVPPIPSPPSEVPPITTNNSLPDKSLTISRIEIDPPVNSGWDDQHIKLSWTLFVDHVDLNEIGLPIDGIFLIDITGHPVNGEARYSEENKFEGSVNGIDPGICGGTITITVTSFIGDNNGNYLAEDDDQRDIVIPPYKPDQCNDD